MTESSLTLYLVEPKGVFKPCGRRCSLLIDQLIDWLFFWLIDWLIDWSNGRLIDSFIHWLTNEGCNPATMWSGYTVRQLGSQASSCYSGHFIWSGQGTFLSPTNVTFFSHAPWDAISEILKSSGQKLFLGKERSNICHGERFSSSIWSARANRKVSALADFWRSRELFLESANHFTSRV